MLNIGYNANETRYKMQYKIKAHKYNAINNIRIDCLLLKKGVNRLHNKIIVNTIDNELIVTIIPIIEEV